MSIHLNRNKFFHVVNDKVYFGTVYYPITELYEITEYCEKTNGRWRLLPEHGDITIRDIAEKPQINIKLTFTVRKKP